MRTITDYNNRIDESNYDYVVMLSYSDAEQLEKYFNSRPEEPKAVVYAKQKSLFIRSRGVLAVSDNFLYFYYFANFSLVSNGVSALPLEAINHVTFRKNLTIRYTCNKHKRRKLAFRIPSSVIGFRHQRENIQALSKHLAIPISKSE